MKKTFILSILIVVTLFTFSCKNDKKEKITIKHTKKIISETKPVSKEKVLKINKKLLLGSWVDPSEAALHFTIEENGKAHSDNMATLLYQKWQLDGNKIIFTIKSIGNHTSSVFDDVYKILQLDNTVLVLKSKFATKKYYRKHPSITNIKVGQKITSPVSIEVNSKGIWFATEGQLGLVEIIDDKGNVLNKKNDWGMLISSDGNWMHSKPAFFKTKITFNTKGAKKGVIRVYGSAGLPEGTEGGMVYFFDTPITF